MNKGLTGLEHEEKLRDAKEENIKIHATLEQTLSELNSF